ncbi:hypothetical protein L360_04928 [Enterobacter sp. MGH 14]|nr:hypothetical protein L360_04928 [Enterobacter sp. MGH 14]
MPVLFRVKVYSAVLLLAMIFAFLLNWPILLHFYEILSHLEHVKIGFVISIPFVLVAALNVVFIAFLSSFSAETFLCFTVYHWLTGQLFDTKI